MRSVRESAQHIILLIEKSLSGEKNMFSQLFYAAKILNFIHNFSAKKFIIVIITFPPESDLSFC